jgi:hypothetical protein
MGLIALSMSGCIAEATTDAEDVPALNIPEPKAGRTRLPAELAAMVYPEDAIVRDPFLTAAEQRLLDGYAPPPPTVDEKTEKTEKPKTTVANWKGSPNAAVIKQLHEEVNGIILGPRNTFLFRGRLYEEGDAIEKTDWVVRSITESGILLRSKDGNGVDFLKFKRDTILPFDFGKK